MTDVVSVNISGVEQALNRMAQLTSKVQRTEARRAARKGAIVFRTAARNNARAIDDPNTRESIVKNIAVQESRRQSKAVGGVVMRVGVMGGARKVKGSGAPAGDTYYWRFHEFGTSKMRARPFMRPVLSQKAQEATDATSLELSASLDRLLP